MPIDCGGYAGADDDNAKSSKLIEGRVLKGFWLVWQRGMEWPEQFYSEEMAKQRANVLARTRLGHVVHVCQLEQVGALMIPHNPSASGVMVE